MKNLLLILFCLITETVFSQKFVGQSISAGVLSRNISDMPVHFLSTEPSVFEIKIEEDSSSIYIWTDTTSEFPVQITITGKRFLNDSMWIVYEGYLAVKVLEHMILV